MFATTTIFGRPFRPFRRCCWAMLLLCLAVAGCSAWHQDYDFSGMDDFRGVPSSEWKNEFRPVDYDSTPHAVTNKGLEIERSLGVR